MNLIDMVTRKDPRLQVVGGQMIAYKTIIDGQKHAGFKLRFRHSIAIQITRPRECYPMSKGWLHLGWKLLNRNKMETFTVELAFYDKGGKTLFHQTVPLNSSNSLLTLQKQRLPEATVQTAERLELKVSGSSRFKIFRSEVVLSVYQPLSRQTLYDQCVGKGVELGPGPKPQILPGKQTEVLYVEQKSPEEWEKLYNTNGKFKVEPKLWDRFVIGTADKIPVEEESIDFIFSSHVFEHLANPLGHLELWYKKLRPGGKVLCVIPSMEGCKDYIFEPSKPDAFLREYESRSLTPNIDHYRLYCEKRLKDKDPVQLMADEWSIHCHYYTHDNIQDVVQLAKDRFGYKDQQVFFAQNHKDMYFVLEK